MNSTLGSVVPLAMFIFKLLVYLCTSWRICADTCKCNHCNSELDPQAASRPKLQLRCLQQIQFVHNQGLDQLKLKVNLSKDKSRIAFAELLCEVLRRAKDIQEKPYCGGVVSSSPLKPRKSPNLAKFRQSVFLSRASHTYKRH